MLGTDALFAALPATPVQLAHACQRVGYTAAFPASWGDELIAGACLRDLADRPNEPAILCACPNVRDVLLRTGSDLAPWMISLVPPPVAVARYLRAAYGARTIHITYVGACPGADDRAIDVRLSPTEFLTLCRERGVSPAAQPPFFEGIIPPDRRRSLSMPGGAPSDAALRDHAGRRQLVELTSSDTLTELAQRLLARQPVLIDLVPHVGCACSGVGDAVGGRDERRQLIALEPPRSRDPVLDPAVRVDLEIPGPVQSPGPLPRVADAPAIASLLAPSVAGTAPAAALSVQHSAHAVILEYPQARPARRALTTMRRRPAIETPAAALNGDLVPRAYLAKRHRRPPPRRQPNVAAIGGSSRRFDRERRIDRPLELADARRPRRSPLRFVTPPSSEPPRPVPPPPGKRKTDPLLGIGAVIGFALSIAATGAIPY